MKKTKEELKRHVGVYFTEDEYKILKKEAGKEISMLSPFIRRKILLGLQIKTVN